MKTQAWGLYWAEQDLNSVCCSSFCDLRRDSYCLCATISPPTRWTLHNAMACSIVRKTVANTDGIGNCHLLSTDYPSANVHTYLGTYSPYDSPPRMSFFLVYAYTWDTRVHRSTVCSWSDSSVDKLLATQVWEPKFNPQYPREKLSSGVLVCNLSIKKAEAGVSTNQPV